MSLGERAPFTYLITPGETTIANYFEQKSRVLETIRDAVDDGVDLVQVREKALSAKLLHELARSAVDALCRTPARVLVNDRADVAIAAGAHGVHLPANSLTPATVRLFAPRGFIVGVSTHTLEEARAAHDQAADLVTFGPLFSTPGKLPPVGTSLLRAVCDAMPGFPVFGLGGINADNIVEVVEAGASGIAAIRALNNGHERREVLNRLGR